jgi:hypothetical protein
MWKAAPGNQFPESRRGDMAVDEDNESPTMGTFVLCLRLGGTEPPSGTISALGAPVAQPFYGWIELMSTINTLRGWEKLPPGEYLPPEAPC